MFSPNRISAYDPSRLYRLLQSIRILALAALAVPASAAFAPRHSAQAADTLHFAVGPLQPTPGETKRAFDPFFKYLAERLGVTYTLEATTDWAGIAVALTSGQVDAAWRDLGVTSSRTTTVPGTRSPRQNTTASPSIMRLSSPGRTSKSRHGPTTAKGSACPSPMWVPPRAGSFQPSGSNPTGSIRRPTSSITRAQPTPPTRSRWPMDKLIS